MEKTDVLIIGAGLLGCFSALHLRKYNIKVRVLEQNGDVSTGISKSNTGIVYCGHDVKPGTLKAQMCVRSNAGFEELCRKLDVRFSRCGSLLLSFGERGDSVIRKKMENGTATGVPGLKVLSREEVLSFEPAVSPHVRQALYAANTGTVNPWELCIAAYECALQNGAEFSFETKVTGLQRDSSGFLAQTDAGPIRAEAVINCAGLLADRVREFCEQPKIRLFPSSADYLVTDIVPENTIRHILFQEPEKKGKGLTIVPTIDGNLLIGPTWRHTDAKAGFPTEYSGIQELMELCRDFLPGLRTDNIIRSFGSARPDSFYVSEANGVYQKKEKDISGFTLLEENGMLSMIGIKTPGLTCANELGIYAAEKIRSILPAVTENPEFRFQRSAIPHPAFFPEDQRAAFISVHPDYGKILCRCRHVSEGEIREAIRRGARTIDAVKRRTGAGMGRCQGAYCMLKIAGFIAEETGLAVSDITKDGPGTEFLT